MKLSEYAKRMGIGYSTAKERFRMGKIPGAYKDDQGQVVVLEGAVESKPHTIKLARFAEDNGISYRTALRMFHKGEIPGAFRLGKKMILVPMEGADCSDKVILFKVSKNNKEALINWSNITEGLLNNRYKPLVAKQKMEQMEEILGARIERSKEK